jgi:DNA mismatch endonuclease (patch repair protein)
MYIGSAPSKTRSYNMSRIRGKNTKPEILVRKWLWSKGYRYKLHRNELPGKPDIVFPGRKKAIFINGCFWHRHDCRYFKYPGTNIEFWKQKIGSNLDRDNNNYVSLADVGWSYLIIWECETKERSLDNLWIRIEKFLI